MQEAQTLTVVQYLTKLYIIVNASSLHLNIGKKILQSVLYNIFKVGLENELVLSISACATPFFFFFFRVLVWPVSSSIHMVMTSGLC